MSIKTDISPPLVGGDKGEGAPSPQPSPACGHLPAAQRRRHGAQAGIKGEGVFLQFVNY